MRASPDQRAMYAGLFSTVAAVVSLIAPFIGGTLAQQIGYEALFVVALAMVLGASRHRFDIGKTLRVFLSLV